MRACFRLPNTLRIIAALALGLPALAAADAKLRLTYDGKSQEVGVSDLAKLPLPRSM